MKYFSHNIILILLLAQVSFLGSNAQASFKIKNAKEAWNAVQEIFSEILDELNTLKPNPNFPLDSADRLGTIPLFRPIQIEGSGWIICGFYINFVQVRFLGRSSPIAPSSSANNIGELIWALESSILGDYDTAIAETTSVPTNIKSITNWYRLQVPYKFQEKMFPRISITIFKEKEIIFQLLDRDANATGTSVNLKMKHKPGEIDVLR